MGKQTPKQAVENKLVNETPKTNLPPESNNLSRISFNMIPYFHENDDL